jgi:hypothetical protein
MRARSIWILLSVVLTAACGNSPAAPTADELAVAITPSPLAVPAAGGRLVWNASLRAMAGIGLRLDRDEMVAEYFLLRLHRVLRRRSRRTEPVHDIQRDERGVPRCAASRHVSLHHVLHRRPWPRALDNGDGASDVTLVAAGTSDFNVNRDLTRRHGRADACRDHETDSQPL